MSQPNDNNAVAIVTGACGGMGAPAATRLAARGFALLLCDIDPGRLERIAAPLRAGGTTVDVLAGDVADRDYPQRVLEALGDRPVGALVHTAGLSPTLANARTDLDGKLHRNPARGRSIAPQNGRRQLRRADLVMLGLFREIRRNRRSHRPARRR